MLGFWGPRYLDSRMEWFSVATNFQPESRNSNGVVIVIELHMTLLMTYYVVGTGEEVLDGGK